MATMIGSADDQVRRELERSRQLEHVTAVIRRELANDAHGVIEVHIQDGRLVRTKVSRTEKIP